MFYAIKTKKALQEGFTVRITGLEPAWVSPLEPETSASANSAISASANVLYKIFTN